ncbi:MAG TPA: helicase-related protein [Lactovum miscens]|uniref:helicase-related protein n=1 Tax=Lactovum miscens TaxID=190387 RepID=UPI002EDB1D69
MAIDNYIPKLGDENRIDNKGRTMRGAIAGLMSHSNRIRIASGYFRLSGIAELEDDFRNFFAYSDYNKVELLLSNQYDTKNPETRDILGIAEKGVEHISEKKFYLDNQFYQQLVKWIQTERLEVKIFVDEDFYKTHSKRDIAFLHGKAYLFTAKDEIISNSVLIGSSNFTYGGLVENRELNIFSSDSFSPIRSWFDEMWKKYSENYADELIADLEVEKEKYAKPKISFTPIEYFYWNLGKYFGEKASQSLISRIKKIEENLPYPSHGNGAKFFAHQNTGIQHVYQALNKFDTQILADGVGLGKTLEAASIIKLYLQDLSVAGDKRRILILANDRIREQWQEELRNVGVENYRYDIKTRQKFTNLTEEEIHIFAESYALVVIDEAHEGFLRQGNKAYQNMKAMISYARDTQSRTMRGLLLTATPWNNSREDVIRLGLLFLNLEKVPTSRQYYNYVSTKREKLLYDTNDDGNYNQQAYVEFWKDLYYQRTRSSLANDLYLSDRYPTREFPLENGSEPFVIQYSPQVSSSLQQILEQLITLKLPYQDTIWQYFGSNQMSNVILRQKFQLLRRADSSNAAFGKSLMNIKSKLESFLSEISNLKSKNFTEIKRYFYSKVNEDFAQAIKENEDGIDLGNNIYDNDIQLNKAQQDRIRMINELFKENLVSTVLGKMASDAEGDIQTLDEILNAWEIVSKQDEKQNVVIKQIRDIVKHGKKVLIFSEFKDTVEDYFRKMLKDELLVNSGIGMVHGGINQINFDETSKKEVLGRFTPISKSYELFDKTEISVLIGTDAISTGQNLQDASHVMTIELPYNPMRLEQRIGRIDRPKAKGENEIFVYAFPSEEIIGAELQLSERFENKAQGATSDTEGDFKLPFVHNGKFKGIIESLKDEESLTNNHQDELVASVSEFEARERVQNFYDEIGDNFVKDREFYDFPYSFVSVEKSLVLAKGKLKDINDKEIEETSPEIWDISNIEMIEFVEAENCIKSLLGRNKTVETDVADKLIDNYENKKSKILEKIVLSYNNNLIHVDELEQSPTYILDLRKQLLDNMRSFRSSFAEQKVSGKVFSEIAKSLNNQGFNAEQKLFLKNLQDQNGQLSTPKINQNIWRNLNRFIEVFGTTILGEIEFDNVRTRANLDLSELNILAGAINL